MHPFDVPTGPSLRRIGWTMAAIVLAFVVAGAVVGWIWFGIWDSPPGIAYDGTWLANPPDTGNQTIFSATAVFVLLGFGVALVLGLLASLLLRGAELSALLAVFLGTLLATTTAYVLGTSLGPPDSAELASRAVGGADDGQEIVAGTDPNDGTDDPDKDAPAYDGQRPTTKPTAPTAADSDGDGLTDEQERTMTGTDPEEVDTDGNGVSDADEDLDGDGLTNLQELTGSLNGAHDNEPTSPFTADSDANFTKIPGSLSIAGHSPFVAWPVGGLLGMGVVFLFTLTPDSRRRPQVPDQWPTWDPPGAPPPPAPDAGATPGSPTPHGE